MNNNKLFLDERLVQNICSLCGEVITPDTKITKEHVIPRVFLEKPFPKELPTTLSCLKCNNSYSIDEQYLACLIECVISGTTDPNKIVRKRISRTLEKDVKLRKMLENKKIESNEGRISFSIDNIDKRRIENVLVKLARTHLFYLINEINLKDPKDLIYCIGQSTESKLRSLWMVYGCIYAAKDETYDRIKSKISEGIKEIPNIVFSKIKELGRVNQIDPLGITSLRIRGMWQIENPRKVFHYLHNHSNENFELICIIPDKIFLKFPKSSIQKINSIKEEGFSLNSCKVKDPNNPAELIDCKICKFSF